MEYDLEMGIKRCRAMGSHAFEPFAPLDRPKGSWRRIFLRCIYCTTERHDTLNVLGQLQQRKYIYPQGYSRDRYQADNYRLEFYKAYERMNRDGQEGS